MTISKRTMILVLAAALLVSCGGQPPASPTPDIDAILTESVATAAAYFQQTMTAAVPPATNTPLATVTPLSTNTPLALPSAQASPTQGFFATSIVVPSVTGTIFTPTTSASSLAYGCNNLGLINDLEISSDNVKPGDRVEKRWQVANTGTCDWLFGYTLVPVSGSNLANDAVRLNKKIEPGKWTQLAVSIVAPKDPGTYTQNWRLTDGAGNAFGATLAVTITVKKPAPTYP